MVQSKVWLVVMCVLALVASVGVASSQDKAKPKVKASSKDKAKKLGMVVVPAGEFIRGSEKGHPAEKPVKKIYLDEFWIDIYEVTVDEYFRCVKVGNCERPKEGGPACSGNVVNWEKKGRGNHPINCVTAFNAEVFCKWAGKRLPTEAEWEKAARGTDGRTYPWGEAKADCNRAVMNDGGLLGCGELSTWPVESKPSGVSPYGAHNMAGNVSEWTADRYDSKYYSTSPARNPQGPKSGVTRVIRGGCWFDFASNLRSAERISDGPSNAYDVLGFRCARSLD